MKVLKRYMPIMLVALLLLSASCSNDTSPPESSGGPAISTEEEFMNALESDGSFYLTADITISPDNPYRPEINNQNLEIDLNGHTVNTAAWLDIYGGSLTLKNGTIKFISGNFTYTSGYAIQLYSQSALVLDEITMTSVQGGIQIQNQADTVKLDINKSDIAAVGFAIIYDDLAEGETNKGIYTYATNVDIDITDSNIKAVYSGSPDEYGYKYNTAAFVLNCQADVNVSGSTFTGDRQAYIARGGEHHISNTEMYVTGLYEGSNYWLKMDGIFGRAKEWQYRNRVPNGGLIIGGHNAYRQIPVTVYLDETVKINMENVSNENYYGLAATRTLYYDDFRPGYTDLRDVKVYLHGSPTIKVGENTVESINWTHAN